MKSWPKLDTKYFSYELFPVNLLLSYSIHDNIITVKLRYSFGVLKNNYDDNNATTTKNDIDFQNIQWIQHISLTSLQLHIQVIYGLVILNHGHHLRFMKKMNCPIMSN